MKPLCCTTVVSEGYQDNLTGTVRAQSGAERGSLDEPTAVSY